MKGLGSASLQTVAILYNNPPGTVYGSACLDVKAWVLAAGRFIAVGGSPRKPHFGRAGLAREAPFVQHQSFCTGQV